jgi:hypothetical protein
MNVALNQGMCRAVARFRRKLAQIECEERGWCDENEAEMKGERMLEVPGLPPDDLTRPR